MYRHIALFAALATLPGCDAPTEHGSALQSDSFTRVVHADGFTSMRLFTQLKTAGVVDTHVITGGETYRAKSLQCWRPVVPNPSTECRIDQDDDASLTVRGELADGLRNSLTLVGAAYSDGSVGAEKWRADDVECTGLVSPTVHPMCEMLVTSEVQTLDFRGDDASKVFDILVFAGIPVAISGHGAERVALSKVSCSRPVVPNAVTTCEYLTLDDRLFTKTGASSTRLLRLLGDHGAHPPGIALGASRAVAVDLACVRTLGVVPDVSCTFSPETL
jgi:hypothetical protein